MRGSNAPFILIIALFIIVFIVVSYFLVSGSAFGDYYVDNLDDDTKNNKNNNSNNSSKDKCKSDVKSCGGEVYNIRDNMFTYDEAKAVCAAHGARLATLEEMIAAYDKGANWCSYGWTQGQLALYPTQKEYWAKLQADSKRRKQCGEPGINGGFFQNPEFKFGANCYGKKPIPKSNEVVKPENSDLGYNPYAAKIEEYKAKINDSRISPFSEKSW